MQGRSQPQTAATLLTPVHLRAPQPTGGLSVAPLCPNQRGSSHRPPSPLRSTPAQTPTLRTSGPARPNRRLPGPFSLQGRPVVYPPVPGRGAVWPRLVQGQSGGMGEGEVEEGLARVQPGPRVLHHITGALLTPDTPGTEAGAKRALQKIATWRYRDRGRGGI